MYTINTTFNILYQITGNQVPVSQIGMTLSFDGTIPTQIDSNLIVSVNFDLLSQHIVISQTLPASAIQYQNGKGILQLEGMYMAIGEVTSDQIINATGEIWYIGQN
ncbi:hypothetical protein [Niameybacter massiliensis]|uniref:hypothetical protein n=1 Tax=Niameybacter massiliensis TaxID=1658108 RepID=UPI0006B68AEA|nr:hypothetical protein [Niameybacter massiliensis]